MNNRVSKDSPTWKRVEELLLQLLAARTIARKQAIHREDLLPVFKRFPHLANERYYIQIRGGDVLTPLACLLEARMDVSDMESLFECMDPSVLSHLNMLGRRQGSVFHMACRDRSDEVVCLLLSKLEEAAITKRILSREDHNGRFAFDLAIKNSRLQSSTKQQLLGFYPEAVGDGAPLAKVLQDSDLEMLEFIVNVWPSTNTHVNLEKWRSEGATWTLPKARIFCELFPKINSISHFHADWEIPAFRYFLNELECNNSIVKIDFFFLPQLDGLGSPVQQSVIQDFQQILKNKTKLEHLTMGIRSNIATTLSWMQAIDRSVQYYHNSLQKLYVGMNNYFELDTEDWTTEQLAMHDHRHDRKKVTKPPLSLNIPNLSNFDASDRALVLDTVPRFSHLLTVGIRLDKSSNEWILRAAYFVIALLNSDHQFKHLHLTVPVFNLDLVLLPVCKALVANKNLLSFDAWGPRFVLRPIVVADESKEAWLEMLKEHNFTLTTCHIMGKADPRIQHYLDLNRHGRSAVRGTSTPLRRAKLIAHLMDAWNDPILYPHTNRTQSIVYGLLRENPDLWCHIADESSINSNTEGRKRKHASV